MERSARLDYNRNMAEVDSRQPFPERGAEDVSRSAMRAMLTTAVPGLSALAVELFDWVITPPLERRRTDWLNDLAARLDDLAQKIDGFSVSSLIDSPEFITAVTTASQIAIRNHSEEKIAALRNAAVNVALGEEIENELYLVLLALVDTLTPLHLRVLAACRDAPVLKQGVGRTDGWVDMRTIIEQAVPGIPLDVLRQIARDLHNSDLIDTDQLHVAMSIASMATKHTTDFGDRFLKFITESEPTQ